MTLFAPILPKNLRINPAATIAAASLSAATSAEAGLHFRYAESLI
jgi:hypothetical protein